MRINDFFNKHFREIANRLSRKSESDLSFSTNNDKRISEDMDVSVLDLKVNDSELKERLDKIEPETKDSLHEDKKNELTLRFRKWLDSFDGILSESIQFEDNTKKEIDLFTLFSEFIALKNEVKLENRQFKRNADQFKLSLDLLQSGFESLLKEQSSHKETINNLREAVLKSIIIEIFDIRDRIEDSLRILKSRRYSLFRRIFRRKDQVAATLIEGQEMLMNRLDRMLISHGVLPIETENKTLDPHLMRVIEVENYLDKGDGIVLEEIRKGFLLNGTVLRIADVKVNKRKNVVNLTVTNN